MVAAAFWVVIVALAFVFLDWLFPRIRHSSDPREETPIGPAPPIAAGAQLRILLEAEDQHKPPNT